jgi:hypothetical protein
MKVKSAKSKDEREYRVFISYSHQDLKLVRAIHGALRRNHLAPMWDEHFAYGQGFHNQIKNFIAHAHVFVPVLTHTSNQRNWVHQEIGFATALNIPVRPIAIGELPGEMISHLHAIRVVQGARDAQRGQLSAAALRRIERLLTRDVIEQLVESSARLGGDLFACAEYPDARAEMIAQYCEDVRALGKFGMVRQKGALSSFHLPTETINHRVWKERYGGAERSDEHCRLQRRERIALTRHTEAAGCKLIINPYLRYQTYGEKARLVRLKCLCKFLEGMPDQKCQIAILNKMDHGISNTYVGDWFSAESVSAILGKGYYQTIFTRHAASLQEKIANFDSEFQELLADNGTNPANSRIKALQLIGEEIQKLEK